VIEIKMDTSPKKSVALQTNSHGGSIFGQCRCFALMASYHPWFAGQELSQSLSITASREVRRFALTFKVKAEGRLILCLIFAQRDPHCPSYLHSQLAMSQRAASFGSHFSDDGRTLDMPCAPPGPANLDGETEIKQRETINSPRCDTKSGVFRSFLRLSLRILRPPQANYRIAPRLRGESYVNPIARSISAEIQTLREPPCVTGSSKDRLGSLSILSW
jgi:hypothetical protein